MTSSRVCQLFFFVGSVKMTKHVWKVCLPARALLRDAGCEDMALTATIFVDANGGAMEGGGYEDLPVVFLDAVGVALKEIGKAEIALER